MHTSLRRWKNRLMLAAMGAALLVCLIPTTIGALLAAIGIAGMDRALRANILSKSGSFYARTILGIDVRDVTAGFICWRRDVLEALDLPTVDSNGYSFQIEMKYRALKRGYRVVETPIIFVDRRVGDRGLPVGVVGDLDRNGIDVV